MDDITLSDRWMRRERAVGSIPGKWQAQAGGWPAVVRVRRWLAGVMPYRAWKAREKWAGLRNPQRAAIWAMGR